GNLKSSPADTECMNETAERDFSTPIVVANEKRRGWEGMDPRNLFAELKRRHVYRAAIAYGVAAWLLVQIATQVFPFFEIPSWIVRLIVLATVLGFPIALTIAWPLEMPPVGLNRHPQRRRHQH